MVLLDVKRERRCRGKDVARLHVTSAMHQGRLCTDGFSGATDANHRKSMSIAPTRLRPGFTMPREGCLLASGVKWQAQVSTMHRNTRRGRFSKRKRILLLVDKNARRKWLLCNVDPLQKKGEMHVSRWSRRR
jgi:hypothetical protein